MDDKEIRTTHSKNFDEDILDHAVIKYVGGGYHFEKMNFMERFIVKRIASVSESFERIREELQAGKGVIAAVDTGFDKAFLTIIDTHVTTVVSCAFLFMFGTGPVKGFAVTLGIGVITTMFTAVTFSRMLVLAWYQRRRPALLPL